MTYTPAPINTSAVTLSDSLTQLVEKLAANTHDVWARQRLSEGWSYGPERDDSLLQTPCLVPYAELAENEKGYDRNTAIEAIKAIIELGFQIADPAQHNSPLDDQEYHLLQEKFAVGKVEGLSSLIALWQQRDHRLWHQYPELHLAFAEIILAAGEPLLAYDVCSQGLTLFGDVITLEQLVSDQQEMYGNLCRCQALALAQSGAVADANKLLCRLIALGIADPETKGLLGRTYKDMALVAPAGDDSALQAAHGVYLAAMQDALAQGDDHSAYYNGINAATMALMAGDESLSKDLAQQVADICQKVAKGYQENDQQSPFWLDATLAEAALLMGNIDAAKQQYGLAAKKAAGDIRSIASMEKQACLICRSLGEEQAPFQAVFNTPTVLVFSGHMIDLPGRRHPRFPVEKEDDIRQQIRVEISNSNGAIGYAAAACGSDILFLEEMLGLGGEINIILPIPVADFKKQSVTPGGEDWEQRFDVLLGQAASIKVLDQYNPSSFENSLEFCNHYLFGLARSRAQQIGTSLYPLAVFAASSDPALPGGAGAMIVLWQQQHLNFGHIALGEEKIAEIGSNHQPVLPLAIPEHNKVNHHLFVPMLFADVKGYSQLDEEQVVCFSTVFLEKMAQVVDRYRPHILSRRTMGDGLFLVFCDLTAAIHLARDMQSMIAAEDWSNHKLPADLQMRISLDAGPCYSYQDPVMNQTEYCGNYVVRAARMEPVTPPGHIYASDTFVALCHALGIADVRFDYAGQVALPKNYGTIQAYHVR